ncbi:hypothetical protein Avbf_04403 [Armadillidium vulgare]|nr:hypothetical protein Avbf_04403 [Armadillidium vulgare]
MLGYEPASVSVNCFRVYCRLLSAPQKRPSRRRKSGLRESATLLHVWRGIEYDIVYYTCNAFYIIYIEREYMLRVNEYHNWTNG